MFSGKVTNMRIILDLFYEFPYPKDIDKQTVSVPIEVGVYS